MLGLIIVLDGSEKLRIEEWKKQSGYDNYSPEQRKQAIILFKTALKEYRKNNAINLSEEYTLVRKGCSRGE